MKTFDHWIFNTFPASAESLGLYRILFALFSLIVVTPGHSVYAQFALLSNFPPGFFDPPPGPMMLFGGMPGELFFNGLVLCLNISLVALLFGYKTFYASLLTGLLFLVGFGFSYSLGKVNHNLLFVILPLILMWSNWGAAWSWDAMKNPSGNKKVEYWPLTLLMLFIGFMMFTAGFPKILGGWLDPDSLATRGHLFRQHFVAGRTDLLSGFFLSVEARWFWISLDYLTVIFETGFVLAMLHPVTARIFLVLAVIFHSGTLLMLNIAFAGNIMVYGAFVNWKAFADRLKPKSLNLNLDTVFDKLPAWIIIPAAGLMIYFWGSPFEFINRLILFTSDMMLLEVITVLTALAGVVIVYGYKAIIWWYDYRKSEHRDQNTELKSPK